MTREALTTRSDQEKEERKEAMKRLRLERKQKIAAVTQKVKAQKKVIEALKADAERGREERTRTGGRDRPVAFRGALVYLRP